MAKKSGISGGVLAAVALLAFLVFGNKGHGGPSGPATVTGTVTYGDMNTVLAGAVVTISGQTATADAQGQYSLTQGLTAGVKTVKATASGYATYSAQVELTVGPNTVNIHMAPTQVYTASVSGYITDKATQAAAAGATVTLNDGNNSVSRVTDANGFFSFTSLLAGFTFTWRIDKPEYESLSGSITVSSGVNDLSRALNPLVAGGPAFAITGVAAGGTPYSISVPSANLVLTYIAPKVSAVVTNNGGSPASHTISLRADVWDDRSNTIQQYGFLANSQAMTLNPGQSANFRWDAYDPVRANPANIPSQLIPDNSDGIHDNGHWDCWLEDELGNKTSPKVRIG